MVVRTEIGCAKQVLHLIDSATISSLVIGEVHSPYGALVGAVLIAAKVL
jgi:hypothetical protein